MKRIKYYTRNKDFLYKIQLIFQEIPSNNNTCWPEIWDQNYINAVYINSSMERFSFRPFLTNIY